MIPERTPQERFLFEVYGLDRIQEFVDTGRKFEEEFGEAGLKSIASSGKHERDDVDNFLKVLYGDTAMREFLGDTMLASFKDTVMNRRTSDKKHCFLPGIPHIRRSNDFQISGNKDFDRTLPYHLGNRTLFHTVDVDDAAAFCDERVHSMFPGSTREYEDAYMGNMVRKYKLEADGFQLTLIGRSTHPKQLYVSMDGIPEQTYQSLREVVTSYSRIKSTYRRFLPWRGITRHRRTI